MTTQTIQYGIELSTNDYKDYVHLNTDLRLNQFFPNLEALQEIIKELPRNKYPFTAVCYNGKKLINAISIDMDGEAVIIKRYFENGHFEDYFPGDFGLCKNCYLSEAFTQGKDERNSFV